MIKIKHLDINTFKLLKDTEISFEDKSGIISLEGSNLDNPLFQSNSVGKSTLPDVILQGLFGKNLANITIEKMGNLYTGQKPAVTITVERDGIDYVIKNDYENNLCKIYKDGVLLDFTRKKDVLSEMEDILGLSFFLFSQLIYVSPSTQSLFSNVSNDAQSKFIQSLLSIEFINDINKKSSADLKTYKGEVNMQIKEINMYQQQVENLSKQLDLVPTFDKTDFTELINTLSADISRQDDMREIIKKNYDKVKKELEQITKQEIELKSELKHLESALNKEEALIKSGSCPTCQQNTDKLLPKTDKSLIKNLKKDIETIFEKVLAKKAELKTIEEELSKIASEISVNRSTLQQYKAGRENQTNAEKQESIRDSLMEQRTDAINLLITKQAELTELEDKVYILELISQSTSSKGYIKERVELFLALFNSELYELGKELLGTNYKISINKSKNVGFELFVDDSEITLNYSSLSSGFKSRVMLLISLALNKTVEILTGISINVLFLDEILSAVDATGVESISLLLNKIKYKFPDKLIFIVSHNQVIKNVDNTLTITRQNDASKLKWNSD